MRLVLVSAESAAGRITRVVLGVELADDPLFPLPSLADIRLATNASAALVSVTPGPALTDSQHALVQGDSGDPWFPLGASAWQLLVLSGAPQQRMHAGLVATLVFSLDDPGPAGFSFIRRRDTFSPATADLALQRSAYDGSVVVVAAP